MSDASTDRDDRPAEVTDPLLWRLAAAVADTHQPEESGACESASCLGAAWPCAAWNSAQEGLRVAQVAPRARQQLSRYAAGEGAPVAADPQRQGPPSGWPAALAPPMPWQPQPGQAPAKIPPAA
ncbi:hypothetical protein [Micromonospora sp. SL4-19]|uniref:hypothetical protein n=1 Tax=Micromonospora sp. SL4-19 TaxID=3399129 RepID=UPI003A4DE937